MSIRMGKDRPTPWEQMAALGDYARQVRAQGGDAFKVRAGVAAMIKLTDDKAVLERLRGTFDAVQELLGLSVQQEWDAHLRATPWHRRRREARNERAWREQRFNERQAEAEAEVSAILRGNECPR